MTGKVLAFPGFTVPDAALPPSEPEETTPPETPAFLDWAYVEIPDLQSKVTELDGWAEQGEDVFWSEVHSLINTLLGWKMSRGR